MRNKRSKTVRILAILFAVVLALSLLAPAITFFAYAAEGQATQAEQNRIDSLGDEYQQLQAKQQEIQSKINQVQGEKQKQVVLSQQIGAQIETTTQQINVLTERIELLQQNILQKEQEQEEKQQEYNATYEKFKERLAALSKIPTGSTLGMVLGADSYSQLVDRNEIMNRVAAYDRYVMNDLTQQKADLAEIQAGLEKDRKSVESDKAQMDQKRQELSAQQAETQKQIHDISALEEQFMQNQAEYKRKMAQIQAELNKIFAEIAARSAMSEYVGGEMQFPVPGLTQITSPFGPRFNGADYHTGVDFSGAGAYGKPVLAANDGVVAKVLYSESGYGKYVILDHGGGITTLYAHNSAILVSEGQEVKRGDTIAQVGSTGWSTGPHCHFEVRVNGSAVNPMPYLKG